MERFTIAAVKHSEGPLTYVAGLASEAWVWLPRRPRRDGALVLADFDDGGWPVVVQYAGGRFRNRSGGVWRDPVRWTYLRMEKEENVHPPSDEETAPAGETPLALRRMIDAMLQVWTWRQMMDAADSSVFGDPEEGAPEGS